MQNAVLAEFICMVSRSFRECTCPATVVVMGDATSGKRDISNRRPTAQMWILKLTFEGGTVQYVTIDAQYLDILDMAGWRLAEDRIFATKLTRNRADGWRAFLLKDDHLQSFGLKAIDLEAV